jgi:hypothetical protein
MKINREWHEAHQMPKNPTLDERLDWHLGHAANCTCRAIPPSIRQELERRGIAVPTPPAPQ